MAVETRLEMGGLIWRRLQWSRQEMKMTGTQVGTRSGGILDSCCTESQHDVLRLDSRFGREESRLSDSWSEQMEGCSCLLLKWGECGKNRFAGKIKSLVLSILRMRCVLAPERWGWVRNCIRNSGCQQWSPDWSNSQPAISVYAWRLKPGQGTSIDREQGPRTKPWTPQHQKVRKDRQAKQMIKKWPLRQEESKKNPGSWVNKGHPGRGRDRLCQLLLRGAVR